MEEPVAHSVLLTSSAQRAKILVVDDDDDMLRLVQLNLEKAGARVLLARSGAQALRQTYEERPDLILLDIRMPDMDGLTVCQRLRTMSNGPIVMLTAVTGSEAVTGAFNLGADDYITKPFDLPELLARAQACLRRAPARTDNENSLILGNAELVIDLRRHSAWVRQREVHLTRTEFDLLVFMARNCGRVLSHDTLKEAIGGAEAEIGTDSLKQFIGRVRQKIETDPRHPRWLLNEHGIGYILEIP